MILNKYTLFTTKIQKIPLISKNIASLHTNPFNKELDQKYKLDKLTKSLSISFRVEDIYDASYNNNIENIKNLILHKLDNNLLYTTYIKIRYSNNLFMMAGNQFGFKYNSDIDLHELINVVAERIQQCLDKYELDSDETVYIQLIFRRVNSSIITEFSKEEVKPSDPACLINKSITKFFTDSIPISVEDSSLGTILNTYSKDGFIYRVDYKINGVTFNFMDKIRSKNKFLKNNHADKVLKLSEDYKFYLVSTSTTTYILASLKTSEVEYNKIKFSLSGTVLNNLTDTLLQDNIILRKDGNISFYIIDGTIFHSKQKLGLIPLPKATSDTKAIENPNIGVIDCETFQDSNDIYKIYSLGFKTNLDPTPVIYYVDSKSNINSSEIVLKLIDELLRNKYDKTNFYCHNLGGFDAVFIIKVLLEYNNLHGGDSQYKINSIFRDDRILKVTISKKINDKVKKFSIKHSYAILNNSLEKLGTSFNISVKKGLFPYKFSKENNLFYIGLTPDISYYNDISNSEYSKLITSSWSFKDETIKYLNLDLLVLYEVLVKANKQIFIDYDIDMLDSLTISNLAMKLFMSKYYNNNIPNINKPSLYNDIKLAYYGGITEVYKPYGENLYYYDVNSLYPYAALNDMPGLDCTKEVFFNHITNLDTLFAFYYCDVECSKDKYIGLLPVRTVSGIHLPVGKWSGWYFSEQLKFAKDNGYKISVIRGYSFNRIKNVFDKYIDVIYKIKSQAINAVQKSMAKSLLNNLLGRFGIKLDNSVTDILSIDRFNKLATMKKINSYKQLDNDKILVTYSDKLDNDIIKSHNLDIVKLWNVYRDKESASIDNTSVIISAAVTAYARIYMYKLKLDILNSGNLIYYSDTDSIVTDKQLDNNIVDPNSLGKLKLEYTIKKAIFTGPKTYCFMDIEDKLIKRAKGVKSNSLVYSDYEKLLNNIDINTALKITSHIDWSLGHVVIGEKDITLKADSYKKRAKVYHNDKWVDTKPIVYESNIFSALFSLFKTLFKFLTAILLFVLLLTLKYLFRDEESALDENENHSDLDFFFKVVREISNKSTDDLTRSTPPTNTEEIISDPEETSDNYEDNISLNTITDANHHITKNSTPYHDDTFDIMAANMEAVISNSGITVLEGYKGTVDLNKIKGLLSEIDVNNNSLPSSSDSYDINTEIVKQIRSGNQVNIYTDSSLLEKSTDAENKNSFALDNKTPTTESNVSKYFEIFNKEKIEKQESVDLEREKVLNIMNRQVVIISKPIGENDPPLPLPSWYDPGIQPSADDLEARANWERNVSVQKYWASKFPFLNEHHEQITLDEKINNRMKGIQKTSNVVKTNTDMLESDPPLHIDKLYKKSGDLLDTDEPLHIKELYKKSGDLLDSEEDLHLDKLFEEASLIPHSKDNNDENR